MWKRCWDGCSLSAQSYKNHSGGSRRSADRVTFVCNFMKRYEIAGLAVDMELSGRAELQAEPYRVPANGPADITFTCDARRVLELNPHMETLDVAGYLGSGTIFARHLLRFQGTYLHASAVLLDGKAYLFSANSGTGKSTHTEKWCRLFGATYLNDDKPALRRVDGTWMAYGTPWSGKHDLSSPTGAPLGGIAFLRRGEENAIRPMTAAEAVPHLVHQSQHRMPKEWMEVQLSLLDLLLREVPVWELTCRNDDDAAILSHSVMCKG